MHQRLCALTGAALLLGAVLASCAPPSPSQRRPDSANVIVITIDTLRADRIGRRTRDGASLTPRIDRLAAGGVRFDAAFSQTNITNPSHVSILSGYGIATHGVTDNTTRASTSVVTLADRLRERGYDTAGFVSAMHLFALSGLDRGFAAFPSPEETEVEGSVTVDKAVSWIAGRDPEAGPFFLWLHLFDPHRPYEPPEAIGRRLLPADLGNGPGGSGGESASFTALVDRLRAAPQRYRRRILEELGLDEEVAREFVKELKARGEHPADLERLAARSGTEGADDDLAMRVGRALLTRRDMLTGAPYSTTDRAAMHALYDAEVATVDREVGRFLDALAARKLLDRSVVVLTGDHGESLGEHDIFFNHRGIFDATLHVPMIVVAPGLAPRVESTARVGLVDIVPTVLDLLDLPPAPDLDGRSLRALMERGEAGPLASRDLFHVNSYGLASAVRSGRWKLILAVEDPDTELRHELWHPPQSLFDLDEDPGETVDRLASGAAGVPEPELRRLQRLLGEYLELPCRFPPDADDLSGITPELLEGLERLGYVGSRRSSRKKPASGSIEGDRDSR